MTFIVAIHYIYLTTTISMHSYREAFFSLYLVFDPLSV